MHSERLDVVKDNEKHAASGCKDSSDDDSDEEVEGDDNMSDDEIEDDSDKEWDEQQKMYAEIKPNLMNGKPLTEK